MAKHALLAASASKRWLSCPPSARLNISETDRASPYALQGTDAHTLCQYKVEKALGLDVEDPVESLDFYDEEMETCATDYAAYVIRQFEAAKAYCKDPLILIEEHLDFSRWVPEGFGTGDCVIVSDKVLHVVDFKYGLGVLVESEMNPQMMCYALGALDLYDGIYDISTVEMTIYQPRRDNISTFIMTRDELLSWADTVLAPTAALAFKGEGELSAGGHCQFCKVKDTCKEYNKCELEVED